MQKLIQLKQGALFTSKSGVTYLTNEQLNAKNKGVDKSGAPILSEDLAMKKLREQAPIEIEFSVAVLESLGEKPAKTTKAPKAPKEPITEDTKK